jgi:hypothetical protein
MEKCFECGNSATEKHHIIPKVMGGKKTIPLCTSCHMKVHGLSITRKTDNHIENIKKGIDKVRAWDLFAVYQAMNLYDAENINQVSLILKENLDFEISPSQAKRLINRILDVDESYLQRLFDEKIDSDLSFIWRVEDVAERIKILMDAKKAFIHESKSTESDKNYMILRQELYAFVNTKILQYKRSQ